MTKLEQEWRTQATNELPHLNPNLSLKLLHKLLIHNIYKIQHITLPNGTHLMTPDDFKIYHKTPSKLEKYALQIVEQLFCYPSCTPNCPNPCTRHLPARTLKPKYISNNQNLIPRISENPPQPLDIQQQLHPNPSHNIINNPIRFAINKILDHKTKTIKDKYKITKKYNTYLCQWTLQTNTIYNKWVPQRDLFPLNHLTVITHNTTLLTEYYTTLQHKYFREILNTHFTPGQNRDTRFIPSSTTVLFTQIFITECNPEKDILTDKDTIQIHNEITHIYEDNGNTLPPYQQSD